MNSSALFRVDAGALADYGLELDYAKHIVSEDVTTDTNRTLFVSNDSEISVDEGKTLTVLGTHWLSAGKMLTKTGNGALYLKGGRLRDVGDITVEEGTLKVRHSSARSDVHGVIVRPNATLEIAESNAMLNGQINLYGGTLKIDDNVSVVSNGTEMAGVYIGLKRYTTASLVIGEEAVKAAIELKPDVVVMDLSMPVMDGVEATRQIREALPDTHVLILTSYSTSVDVSRAMDAGASGAFVKDAEDERLVDAIRTVAASGTAFSPEIETMIKSEPHPPELTERQRKILDATSKGLSSDQIADHLGISTYAVNQHLDAIRRKLGAHNRAETVTIAFRKQLLTV